MRYFKKICQVLIALFFPIFCTVPHASQLAWYVTFSGESATPINNIYALSTADGSIKGEVISNSLNLRELRNMIIGTDGKLYLLNAYKKDSRVLMFDKINPDGLTRNFLRNVVSISTTPGLIHPFFITFDQGGDLYISVQDTNIVLGIYGPNTSQPWTIKPISSYLQHMFPKGIFLSGTFVGAEMADIPPVTSVPSNLGGLTTDGKHSVRGIVFGPDQIWYVSDEAKDRINMYDIAGTYLGNISDPNLKNPDELLYNPKDGHIYIASPGTQRIFKYSLKEKTVKTFINDPVRLASVSGIAFGEDGNFYAGDRNTMSIYRYDRTGSNPNLFAGPFTDSPEGLLPVYDQP
jgi:hypothetical protein